MPALADLRRRAEARLEDESLPDGHGPPHQQTVRELRLHQIELELQNQELQRAHGELARARDHLADLHDSAPIGYVTLDAGGAIRDANPAAAALLGVERSRLVGRPLSLFVAPRQALSLRAFGERVLATSGRHTCELNLLGPGGTATATRLDAARALDGDGREVCRVALIDVSAQKRAEEERTHAQKMELIARLSSGIAHDFSNLLSGVTAASAIGRRDVAPGSRAAACFEEIERAALGATALLRRLLAIGRGDTLAREPHEVGATIRSVDGVLRRLAGDAVSMDFELEDGLWINCEPGHLEQILVNLCVNARDAMPGGGSLTVTAIGVDLSGEDAAALRARPAPGRYVRLRVTDTGAGIDPAVLPRIFDAFFSTKESRGTGLGLHTVAGVVEQLGGAIQVASVPGNGARFNVLLPAAAPPDAAGRDRPGDGQTSLPPESDAWQRAPSNHPTLLIVDDNDDLRRLLGELFANLGYQVLLSSSLAEARAMLDRPASPIDVILTDLGLPDGSGVALVDELRTRRPGVPALLITGHDVHDQALQQTAARHDAELVGKPIELAALVAQVYRSLTPAD
jgi:PAS domain S-box-containing protein